MKIIFLSLACFITFNAGASQVVSANQIQKMKEELDGTLHNRALEFLVAEKSSIQKLMGGERPLDALAAKAQARVQSIAQMASAVQVETAKVFKTSTILNDLEQRKTMAQRFLTEAEPEMVEMEKQAQEDAAERAKKRRQDALKSKYCCCWKLCDSESD